MIILCPKALVSLFSTDIDPESGLEKEFIKRMFSKCVPKAIVPNEVWEAFRYRIKNNSENKENAEQVIAFCRSMIEPEFEKLNEEYQEIEPAQDYTSEELIEKTKELIQRKYAEIDILITPNPEIFQSLPETRDITLLTIDGYYTYNMVKIDKRHWIEGFLSEIQREKWE